MPRITPGFRDPNGSPWHRLSWPYSRAENDQRNLEQTRAPRLREGCGHQCQNLHRISEYLDPPAGETPATYYESTDHRVCCRCNAAMHWFGTWGRHAPIKTKIRDSAGQVVAVNDDAIERNMGLRRTFLAAWGATPAGRPTIDPTHIGWHSGLRRPLYRSSYRWGYRLHPVRVSDRAGVSSGPGSLSTKLCAVCRSTLQTIPLWLFWTARGWPEGTAKLVAAAEAKLWKPGRRSDKPPLTLLDTDAFLPWL